MSDAVIITRKPLSQNQKRWVVKRITENWKYADIIAEFEKKWQRRINTATIMRLKQKHLGSIQAGQSAIVEAGAIQAATLKQQSYRLMQHRMNRAEKDTTELDKLRLQWQNGEISDKEYDFQRSRYTELTVVELTKIADSAHNHAKGADEEPPSPGDKAALDMILEGIRSGNPVNLIQVLNPTITPRP